MIARLIERLQGRGLQDRRTALAVALGLTAVALVTRFLLRPLFGDGHVYAICFPAVLLTVFLGRPPRGPAGDGGRGRARLVDVPAAGLSSEA